MKRLLLASVFALTACQTSGPTSGQASVPAAAVNTSQPCAAEKFEHLVGISGDAVKESMFPQGTRILRPGMVMTMDYRGDRLNVVINESGSVDRVYCG